VEGGLHKCGLMKSGLVFFYINPNFKDNSGMLLQTLLRDSRAKFVPFVEVDTATFYPIYLLPLLTYL